MSTNNKSVEVKVKKDNFNKLKKKLLTLSKTDLLVGVPQEKAERRGKEPITNAELMFMHTNGAPAVNIPPRPTIEPTIEENKGRINKMFKKAIKKAIDETNEAGGFNEDMDKIGLWVSNRIKARFGSEELTPNKPATAKSKGSDRPLIDTGQLRNSVTYVVREK